MDSTQVKSQIEKDSVLSTQLAVSKRISFAIDSTRRADSLRILELNNRLANIRSTDAAERARLNAQIDSISEAKKRRDIRIKRQVDSLRTATVGVPVIIYEDTAFFIYNRLGPFSPSERAARISQKIQNLVEEGAFKETELIVYSGEETDDILYGETILMSVTDRDAFWLDKTRNEVANYYVQQIKSKVKNYYQHYGFIRTLLRVGLLIILLLAFGFGIKYLNQLLTFMNQKILTGSEKLLHGVSYKNYEFLSADREKQLISWILNIIKWVLIVLVFYLSLPVIFSIFPATKGIANTLIGYLLDPFKMFALALIGYIPELFAIVVILIVTSYFVSFLRFLSKEIETGKLHIKGFYPDWASPTFSLVRVIVYAFSFIIIFPYLPGSNSPVFQGVSVFFGLLISLGSSSAIGNIIAGLVITYMRPFKIGDRVKIGDKVGDVIEKTLLVTRLRTIKNEEVTIPNASILTGSTVNYSSSSEHQGLILHTSITIGYDVPWRQVHQLMIDAALKTEGVKADPQPFILQTSLDDFYVSYQLNAYTDEASKAAKIYSGLHANIQDCFNDAGVEIMSPHYRANRDGSTITIPPNQGK
ncbi:MAG: mechanosensitive ion channel family protein [Cyclobacteriaceae bacterium]